MSGDASLVRRRLLALGAASLAAGPATARRAAAAPSDLTGVWTNAFYTYLQRPKALKTLVVTSAEAEAYEAPRRAHAGELYEKEDELGQAESEFSDNGPGLARIRGEIRSSWIVDPPDGRLPWTDQARAARKANDKRIEEDIDNVEVRDTDERCLTANGTGPPLLNSHDGNVITIVQTPGHVAIVTEKNHEARIVRLGARPDEPAEAPGWMGCPVGRWEGATLVVETAHFRPGLTKVTDDLWLSDHARVVERFTRTGPDEITYLFTVSDPTLFTRPWRGEMVFRPAHGQMYEYACHEGNYSLPGILTKPPR
jgi:hypothetical protein